MLVHEVYVHLGIVAREAEAGVLVLCHFVPTRFDEEELLQQVSADFDGPILIGEDLMNVDVAQRRVLSWGMSIALGKKPAAKKKKPKAKPKVTAKPKATAKAKSAAKPKAVAKAKAAPKPKATAKPKKVAKSGATNKSKRTKRS